MQMILEAKHDAGAFTQAGTIYGRQSAGAFIYLICLIVRCVHCASACMK